MEPEASDSGAGMAESPLVLPSELREPVVQHRRPTLVVIAVDASGSMGSAERVAAAKGAVLGLLRDAYQRRDQVALVVFREEYGSVLLRPTASVEVARARLAMLCTGGRTPLAAGITSALDLACQPRLAATHRPLLVLVTDGRATTVGLSMPSGALQCRPDRPTPRQAGSPGEGAPEAVRDGDPVAGAEEAARAVRRSGVESLVVDVETGAIRLGLAARMAEIMGGSYIYLGNPEAGALESEIRSAAGVPVAG